jgi:hypothetical protein
LPPPPQNSTADAITLQLNAQGAGGYSGSMNVTLTPTAGGPPIVVVVPITTE